MKAEDIGEHRACILVIKGVAHHAYIRGSTYKTDCDITTAVIARHEASDPVPTLCEKCFPE